LKETFKMRGIEASGGGGDDDDDHHHHHHADGSMQ
jgi:hypothetical protein